jgi:hypothetical protein
MYSAALKLVVVLTLAGGLSCVLAQDVALPTVDAGLGPCSVDFTVTDKVHKPVYTAMIRGKFKYGFWGLRSMDLIVFTNPNGHARVVGLPTKFRNPPLTFTITHKNAQATWYWTGLDCHDQTTIVLDIP